MTENLDELVEKTRSYVKIWMPTEEDKVEMILSLAGCSASLLQAFSDLGSVEDLSVPQKYAIAVLITNLRCMMKMPKNPQVVRCPMSLPDQIDEDFKTKMIWIVNELHKQIQEVGF